MNFPNDLTQERIKELKVEFTRFRMAYKFALDEMTTKLNILNEEFSYIHDYNPIEHISTRLKSPDSLVKKVLKKNIPLSFDHIRENIRDIAGIRITCSFRSDIYQISEMIQSQRDIEVVDIKDYITNPKPNGYRSLHLILKIPVFMSDREESVYVEVQIRTIAMDFWASLEHKIYYKYNQAVPEELLGELKEAAKTASDLDKKMEDLHKKIAVIKQDKEPIESDILNVLNEVSIPKMTNMLKGLLSEDKNSL